MTKEILLKAPVEISARHIHLNHQDFITLFGKNAELKQVSALSQPGQFTSDSFVTLVSKDNKKEIRLRVMGPLRTYSQIELSLSDAYNLGYKVPIKLSSDIKQVPKLNIKTNLGSTMIPAIVPERHLHITTELAKKYNLKNNQKVSCEIKGERGLVFDNIVVRVDKLAALTVHLDTDEGNAGGLSQKAIGQILKS
jgi:putative phosphotransacetylase